MEELVQAINNLSKISIKDIISILSTIVIAVAVYFQNKRFNKENEILQKKLNEDNKNLQKKINEVENKRLLYNNILSIYNSYHTIKILLDNFNEEENLKDYIIKTNYFIKFFDMILKLKIEIMNNKTLINMILKSDININDALEKICKNYSDFYSMLYKYINNEYTVKRFDTMRRICLEKNINIGKNGYTIYLISEEVNSNKYLYVDEEKIICDLNFRNDFWIRFDKIEIHRLLDASQKVIECFTYDNFYKHFEEYLSIDKMDI